MHGVRDVCLGALVLRDTHAGKFIDVNYLFALFTLSIVTTAVLCCAFALVVPQVDLIDLEPVVPPWKNRPGAPLNAAESGGMKRLTVELLPHAGGS